MLEIFLEAELKRWKGGGIGTRKKPGFSLTLDIIDRVISDRKRRCLRLSKFRRHSLERKSEMYPGRDWGRTGPAGEGPTPRYRYFLQYKNTGRDTGVSRNPVLGFCKKN